MPDQADMTGLELLAASPAHHGLLKMRAKVQSSQASGRLKYDR
jgi:hypothetical protein